MSDRLLREREVGQRLDVSLKSLQKWRREKRGPAYIKLDGLGGIRYRETDIDAWIERNMVATSGK